MEEVLIFDENDDYPSGQPGQFAVCFWISETRWSFEIFNDLGTAETEFQEVLRRPEALSVPVDNGAHLSTVTWMLERQDQTWRMIRQTKGVSEYMDLASGDWG